MERYSETSRRSVSFTTSVGRTASETSTAGEQRSVYVPPVIWDKAARGCPGPPCRIRSCVRGSGFVGDCLEGLVVDGVGLRYTAEPGEHRFNCVGLVKPCQDADGGLALCQLGTDSFAITVVQAEALVVQQPEQTAGGRSHPDSDSDSNPDGAEQTQDEADAGTLVEA